MTIKERKQIAVDLLSTVNNDAFDEMWSEELTAFYGAKEDEVVPSTRQCAVEHARSLLGEHRASKLIAAALKRSKNNAANFESGHIEEGYV